MPMTLTKKGEIEGVPNPTRRTQDWRRAAILAAGALGLAGSIYVRRDAYRRESEEIFPFASAAGVLFGVSSSLDAHQEACDDKAYLLAGIDAARNDLSGESPVLRRLRGFQEFVDVSERLDKISDSFKSGAPLEGCDALGTELVSLGRELFRISSAHRSELEAAGAEIRARYAPVIYCSYAGMALSVAAIAFGLRRKRKPGPAEDPLREDGRSAPADYIWSTFKPDQKEANPSHAEEQGWVRKIENKK